LARDDAAAHRLERRHAFIADNLLNNVSLIGTTTNPPSVTATATVGSSPVGPFTPDGKYAYVGNPNMFVPGTVSVIDTSTNKATATVLVGQGTFGMGLMPPPSVPFLAFGATLAVDVGGPPPEDTFNVHSP
jgi:YVTN family beta-propeller protein